MNVLVTLESKNGQFINCVAELDGSSMIDAFEDGGQEAVKQYVRDKGFVALLSECKLSFSIADPNLQVDRTYVTL